MFLASFEVNRAGSGSGRPPTAPQSGSKTPGKGKGAAPAQLPWDWASNKPAVVKPAAPVPHAARPDSQPTAGPCPLALRLQQEGWTQVVTVPAGLAGTRHRDPGARAALTAALAAAAREELVVELRREPGNPADGNAIQVVWVPGGVGVRQEALGQQARQHQHQHLELGRQVQGEQQQGLHLHLLPAPELSASSREEVQARLQALGKAAEAQAEGGNRRIVRLGRPPRRWKKPSWAAAVMADPPEVVIQARPLAIVVGELALEASE
ncbi:fanconi-associated nuclease, partial [Haematococcus lacustris]